MFTGDHANEILLRALGYPESSRPAFLDGACGDDHELRTEVGRLLDEHQTSRGDAEVTRTTAMAPPTATSPGPVGRWIGPYRVVRKIGQGGMGVVYEAEQQSPRRSVAVKVMPSGFEVDEIRLRMFRREIETLARLKHPNIAAIHEAGVTADGNNFFAMELALGIRLDAFLVSRSAPSEHSERDVRLNLFRAICGAVHYAHQRGVIHRDLKPANILVESGDPPTVKILDFGLARITDPETQAITVMTEVGAVQGTLPYMSPEQARGDPYEIDTRTDVYALGVLLFEMLTGERPLPMERLALPEAVRTICETPPRRLRDTERFRGRSPDLDLETIVAKCLEKQAADRYPSAAALSEDVRRCLESQPILARPPSNLYLLRKFARRNRALVGGVVATLVTLVLGVVVSTAFGVRATRQRHEAVSARNDLQTVVEFQRSLLERIDPEATGHDVLDILGDALDDPQLGEFQTAIQDINPTDLARSIIGKSILEPAARTLGEEFADNPLIEARLRSTLGTTYESVGLMKEAQDQLRTTLELRSLQQGDEHPETLDTKFRLAGVEWRLGETDVAEKRFRELLEVTRRRLGEDHPLTLSVLGDLAGIQTSRGDPVEAELLLKRMLEGRRRSRRNGPGDEVRFVSGLDTLATFFYKQGRYDSAEEHWTEALDAVRENPDPVEESKFLAKLGHLYWATRRFDEAERSYGDALTVQRRALGDHHPRTLQTRGSLANVYESTGRYDEAIRMHEETLRSNRDVLGERHRRTLRSMNNLAVALTSAKRHDEARDLLGRLLVLDEEVQPGRRDHAVHLHTLAELEIATGNPAPAAEHLGAAIEIYERIDDAFTGLAYFQLASIDARGGDRRRALSNLRRALDHGYSRGLERPGPDWDSLRDDPEFVALRDEAVLP